MLPLALLLAATIVTTSDSVTVRVTVDSSRHRVILVAGPFHPGIAPYDHHAGHDELVPDDPVAQFAWPVNGWLRGFRVELVDGSGTRLNRDMLHHLKVVNFGRRQLIYPLTERLAAIGRETADYMLPVTAGVPLDAGAELGVYVMWHPPESYAGQPVFVRLEMRWSPANLQPRPLSTIPLNVDVAFGVGGNTFAVPPGRHERATEFTVPISGRLLGASGHLHNHARGLRLEDVATGKTLLELAAEREADGTVRGVRRKLLATWGSGLRLKAGRRYRLVAVYDNPTTEAQTDVMGIMVGLFQPDDMRRWPAIDRQDSLYRLDLGLLRREPATHAGH